MSRVDWTCETCGKLLPTAARADARYCSKACTSRSRRLRRQVKELRSSRDRCIVTFRHESGEIFTCEGIAVGAARFKDGTVAGGMGAAKADALAQAQKRRDGEWTVLSTSTPTSIYYDLQRTAS